MTERELTLADYLTMLRRHWVMILIFAIIGPPVGYGVSKLLPNRYESKTLVLVQGPSVPSDFVKPIDTTGINERLASMQQEILSRTRLEPIIRQFGLYPSEVDKVPMDDLVGRLQKAIEVTPVEPMAETRTNSLPGFFVNVTLDNPRTAQSVCTAITSMFIQENVRLREQRSGDTTQFMSQQLADARAKLDAQDAKLAAFQSHYMGVLPDQELTNLNILNGLTSQLDATMQALSSVQQDKSVAESTLNQQLAAWQASQSGQTPLTMAEQLVALQNQLADLEVKYTNDYPDVVKTKAEIAALKKKISKSDADKSVASSDETEGDPFEPTQIKQLRAQIRADNEGIARRTKEEETVKARIKLYEDRVQLSPAVELQYKELTRGHETALQNFNDLEKKVTDSVMATELEHRQEGEQFRVLDPANLPDQPSFPKRPLFALGGLAGGLALGVGLAFLAEMRDTSLRSEHDVELALKLPVIAIVPMVAPLASEPSKLTGFLHARAGTGADSDA
jgi:protein tyrosine kinase modulator